MRPSALKVTAPYSTSITPDLSQRPMRPSALKVSMTDMNIHFNVVSTAYAAKRSESGKPRNVTNIIEGSQRPMRPSALKANSQKV